MQTREERSWPMWVGSSADLERLLVALRRVSVSIRDADIARVRSEHDKSLQQFLTHHPDAPRELAASVSGYQERDRRIEALETDWAVKMTSYEQGDSLRRSGPPEELIERLSPSAVDKISLESGNVGGHHVRVDLGRYQCSLEVEGPDPIWVTGVSGELASEIARCVPAWKQIRSPWASVIITLLILGALNTLEVARIPSRYALWLIIASVLTALPVGAGTPLVLQRLFPVFEFTESTQGRGRHVITVLGTISIGIIASLIAAAI